MNQQPHAADEADEYDGIEVARAHGAMEAKIWRRQLEEQGIHVTTLRKGGWLRWLLYLGQVPVSVRVPDRDADRARAYLKKYRFI